MSVGISQMRAGYIGLFRELFGARENHTNDSRSKDFRTWSKLTIMPRAAKEFEQARCQTSQFSAAGGEKAPMAPLATPAPRRIGIRHLNLF